MAATWPAGWRPTPEQGRAAHRAHLANERRRLRPVRVRRRGRRCGLGVDDWSRSAESDMARIVTQTSAAPLALRPVALDQPPELCHLQASSGRSSSRGVSVGAACHAGGRGFEPSTAHSAKCTQTCESRARGPVAGRREWPGSTQGRSMDGPGPERLPFRVRSRTPSCSAPLAGKRIAIAGAVLPLGGPSRGTPTPFPPARVPAPQPLPAGDRTRALEGRQTASRRSQATNRMNGAADSGHG